MINDHKEHLINRPDVYFLFFIIIIGSRRELGGRNVGKSRSYAKTSCRTARLNKMHKSHSAMGISAPGGFSHQQGGAE